MKQGKKASKVKRNIPFRLGLAGSAEGDRVMFVVCNEAGEVGRLKEEVEEKEEEDAVAMLTIVIEVSGVTSRQGYASMERRSRVIPCLPNLSISIRRSGEALG